MASYRGLFAQVLQQSPEAGLSNIGFVGPSMVQITLVSGLIDMPQSRPVAPNQKRRWRPQPDKRFGGAGRLDGEHGNFSGDRHLTAPQVFTPWPSYQEDGLTPNFEGPGPTTADDPAEWSIAVDGVQHQVQRLFRKSTPIQSARISFKDIAHRARHIVTLQIEGIVPVGAEVRLSGPGIGTVATQRTDMDFSETVHVCHAGYALGGSKKGYVGMWLGHDRAGIAGSTDDVLSEASTWHVQRLETGEQVATGMLVTAKSADEPHMEGMNFNGCTVFEADFSEVADEGVYLLVVDGVGASFPFEIGADVYSRPLRLAARWLFHQRSGCEIVEPFGEGRERPRNGHPDDGFEIWQTDIALGRTAEGFQSQPRVESLLREVEIGRPAAINPDGSTALGAPNRDAWGGWHDAGDWDRRIQHMEMVYAIANLVEALPVARSLSLNLPESGKAFADPGVRAKRGPVDLGDGTTVLPDLIHEALWGISLWRRTQRADGAILGGVGYSLEGVLGSYSWNPVQLSYAFGYEEWASFYFAWAAAKLGHVIKEVCGDAVLGEQLIAEATAAWGFAETVWERNILSIAEALHRLDVEREEADAAADEAPRELDADADAAEVSPPGPAGTGGAEEDQETARRRQLLRILAQGRWSAAATLYRASGLEEARRVFEALNPYAPQGPLGDLGALPKVFADSGIDYVLAGAEGRDITPEVADAVGNWVRWNATGKQRVGHDYGLHSNATYPWGRGWLRFGPGANWRAGEYLQLFRLGGADVSGIRDSVYEGMWFGLGCNPSNVSFVQGLGKRQFGDPLYLDSRPGERIAGQISFGVAGGRMHSWEVKKIADALYPPRQDDWPVYAMIFESRMVAICAEHGVKSNAMEWLQATALAHHLASRETSD